MTVTNRKLIGNHALASARSKLRKEMTLNFFTTETHKTQTEDWIHRSKKFMEKLRPETTYCRRPQHPLKRGNENKNWARTLLTTVIRIDARQ